MSFHPNVEPFVDAFVKHCNDNFIGYEFDEDASSGSSEVPFYYDRFLVRVTHAGLLSFDLFVIFNGSNMSDFDVSCLDNLAFNCLLADCDILDCFDAEDPESFCKVFDKICQMWNYYQESKMTSDQLRAHSAMQTMMFDEIMSINRYEVLPVPHEEYICYSIEFILMPNIKYLCLQISFEVDIYDQTISEVGVWLSPLLLNILQRYQCPFKIPKFRGETETFVKYANKVVIVVQNLVRLYFEKIPKKFTLLLLKHMKGQVIHVNFETFRKIQLLMPRIRRFAHLRGIFTITFDNPDDLRPLCEIQVKNTSNGQTFETELSTTDLYEFSSAEITETKLFHFVKKKLKEAEKIAKRYQWEEEDD